MNQFVAEGSLRVELDSLISQSLNLKHQIINSFNQLQNIYNNNQPSTTTNLNQELLSLREQLKRFHSQLRTSGLGALPTSTSTNPEEEAYQIDTLLDQLQNHFQALYQQRQNQREAAGIVIGVIQPSAPSADT
ncbi:hypothetical protein PGTUg99_015866 [Puccinia graminis f. sp. tritici]|uniref:Uncharacterized protein n=1 Tax=Puccinia graminis f. sp. tritici TaxID=56615 RepID=A0A5B0NC56_PUCGR|nr:hypothetical protein PGTUg99_015866 [Puccinia graminis f. sp. tritici]